MTLTAQIEPRPDSAPGSLAPLVSPRSIAIVGASSDPNRIGGLVVDIVKRLGFPGAVYPINPTRDEVQGLKAYPDVLAVPGEIDLAVIAVPVGAAAEAVDACARKGVGAAVMLTAGLGETGDPEGAAAQAAMARRAAEAGMRLLGPNCAGLVNFNEKMAASFHPAFRQGGKGGRIALVAQSGAFGGLAHHEATLRGLSLGTIITTGNEADIQIADCIDHFARDPDVSVILTYVESVRDGPRFVAALEAARRARKPVVMVKVGDSDAGVRAAASHTGALAAPSAVMKGLLAQHGVVRVRSIEELFSIGHAFDVLPLPASRRLGIVTGSGGVGVLLADDASARDLAVPELGPAVRDAIKAVVPYAGVSNPVDVTGQVLNDPELLSRVLATLAQEEFGALVIHTGIATTIPAFEPKVAALAADLRAQRPDMPLLFVGYFTETLEQALIAAGCVCVAEPTHATRAVAALCDVAEAFARTPGRPPAPTGLAALPKRPREGDALALAASAGVPVVPFAAVRGAEAAGEAAEQLGFPVALKLHAASVLHKSDIGGVALRLASRGEVEAAATAMRARVLAAGVPAEEADDFIVARMAGGAQEAIVGVQRDPVLGPVVMFGLGGVDAEAMRDVTFRVGAVDEAEAMAMIREIAAYPRLLPHRGRDGVDLAALAKAISAVSALGAAMEPRVASFEINPLLLAADGVVAVDALVTLAPDG